MTYREAAERVLKDAGRPLTTNEIVNRAMQRGLISTSGKTPAASMSAALYGAPPDGTIQRESEPGPTRARRGSVRWRYVARRSGNG